MLPLRRLAVGVLIVWCVAVRAADASPITYLYTGEAFAPTLQDFIPIGSPATIRLTVDPAVNIAAAPPPLGPPSPFPPNVGGYYFKAVMDFTGREYELSGVFEVNEHFIGGADYPAPGTVLLSELPGVAGPPLIANPPSRLPVTMCGNFVPCDIPFGSADSNSPALPFFPSVSFPMAFTGSSHEDPYDRVTITGSNPQVVPEPSTLLLFGTGMALVVRTIRRRLPSALPD